MSAGDDGITALDAAGLARRIAEGGLSAEAATEAHLDRIAELEPSISAWAHLDRAYALEQARELDDHQAAGRPLAPLHGVPVGIKDIIDVAGLPCENGTPLDAGRRPRQDSTVAAKLRAAGAVILGKTVTTELAVFNPAGTRNPHDHGHTPGGSSSGSAAGVACNMVPLALGTQTNGSVIRPASFCGVVGYKPSRNVVSRHGVLTQSGALDTIGTFARSVADTALLADAIAGFDPADRAMRPAAHPCLSAFAATPPAATPRLAFVRSPVWERGEPDMHEAYARLVRELGDAVETVELPAAFDAVLDLHRTLQLGEIAVNYARYHERGRDVLSPRLREMIEDGRKIRAPDYIRAIDGIEAMGALLDGMFDSFDAIVTPPATGQAPRGLSTTGDPAFCTIWTYTGAPAVTLPLLAGADGLPIGVQLAGRRGGDAALLRIARWLESHARTLSLR